MDFLVWSLVYASMLFIGMMALGEVGRRIALWRAARDPKGAWHGIGVVDAAVFALLGLVIAFTFSGAVARFDARRDLIVQEVNAIGTAYLRIDVLPGQSQAALRESFRRYLDSRIRTYRVLPDIAAAQAEFENSKGLQAEIWSQTLAAARDSQSASMLLLPALNQMFDITTTRALTTLMHPPSIVFGMLSGLALIAAALAGYSMAKPASRDWLHMGAFAAVTAFLFYVIHDIEYPRLGLIRVDAADQALVELRDSMK